MGEFTLENETPAGPDQVPVSRGPAALAAKTAEVPHTAKSPPAFGKVEIGKDIGRLVLHKLASITFMT